MTDDATNIGLATASPLSRGLRGLACILLLTTAAARAMLAEMPFSPPLIDVPTTLAPPSADEEPSPIIVGTSDLSRATWPLVILTAAAFWMLALAVDRNARLAGFWLLVGLAGFVALATWSALAASDRHAAWLVTVEQATLVLAGLILADLARDRKRFLLIVAVLAAVGMTAALKSLYQRLDEIPTRVAQYEADPATALRNMGAEPGTPKARSLESRIRDTSVSGFQPLANMNAAELLILAAAAVGLAWTKLRVALRTRPRGERDGSKNGEIHPPSLAAILTTLGAAAILAALLLTKSKGGIGAAALVAAVAATLWRWRVKLAGRWRRVALAMGVVLLLGAAGVVGYGVSRGRLPSKTLAVRWFYWTGGAELVAGHPLRGVGPGNFATHYLHVRQPQAEEEVKMPHNAVVHAVVQFGLPGGAVYLALAGGMLILASRPRPTATQDATGNKSARGGAPQSARVGAPAPPRSCASISIGWKITVACVVVAVVLLARWQFALSLPDAFLAVFDVFLPAATLAIALAAAFWFGGAEAEVNDGDIARMRLCLAAGAAAFILHNMVTYSLWSAGPAMLFWTAVGTAAGQGWPAAHTLRKLPRWAGVVGCLVLAVTMVPAGKLFGYEVWRVVGFRRAVDEAAPGYLISGRHIQELGQHAVDADTIMLVAKLTQGDPQTRLTRAHALAEQAIQHDPAGSASWRLLAEIRRQMVLQNVGDAAPADVADAYAQAVQRDIANARLRLDYAQALLEAGQPVAAAEQLDEAQRINNALQTFDPTSHKLLRPVELARLRHLRGQITP